MTDLEQLGGAVNCSTEHQRTLSTMERRNLEECEGVVGKFLDSFFKVGKALAEIRDQRLYRETCSSFDVYCRQRWKITPQRAYQHIDASRVVQVLSTTVDESFPLPACEAQVRPLASLEDSVVVEAWRLANERAGEKSITGRIVKGAVRDIRMGRSGEGQCIGLSANDGSKTDSSCSGACQAVAADMLVFELADGTPSEPMSVFERDMLFSARAVEGKLKAMEENNSGAFKHRVSNSEIAERQGLLIKLVAATNKFAGRDPNPEIKRVVYWVVDAFCGLAASLRPASDCDGVQCAAEIGKEEKK